MYDSAVFVMKHSSGIMFCKKVLKKQFFQPRLVLVMHAGASAAAWTCGDSVAIAEVEVTARALAKAVAEAYSIAYVDCAADEGGWLCAASGSSISVWVEAVARAWAGVWAGAYTCTENCEVEIEIVVEAVAHILVDAATSAYASVCGDGACQKTSTFCETRSLESLVAHANDDRSNQQRLGLVSQT
jgi:hypothetical protein